MGQYTSFKDIFREEDLKREWLQTIREDNPDIYHYLSGIKGVGKPYNFAYLAYMAIRLIECQRVLKLTGSIYLHCDPTMSHYLKTVMDCIFGEGNFRNEITWQRQNSHNTAGRFGNITDTILYYAVTQETTWNTQYQPHGEAQLKRYKFADSDGRRYRLDDLTASRPDSDSGKFEWRGTMPGPSRGWGYQLKQLEEWWDQGRIHTKRDGTPRLDGLKNYLDESKGKMLQNLWTDIPRIGNTSAERMGYPTQKPRELLERIILASSNKGDMVLDPFCGCATTCIAAERLGRQWVGIDISVKAYELVQERVTKEVADPGDFYKNQNVIHMKTDPPERTDQAADHREQKYVYVIAHPNFPGEYKVGIAKHWESRLNSYQTSDPERQYKLEFKLLTPWFRETEQYIHDKFPNKHEWVEGELHDIIEAIMNHKPVYKKQDTLF